MTRNCVCGKPIYANRSLCRDCYEIYGDKKEWPMWLSWLVSDIQREIDYENNRKDVEFFDESDYPEKKITRSM